MPVTSPSLINPAGGNRLDVDCVFHTKVVADMVASWWNGDTFALKHWWSGTASVGANANLKALSFSHGEVGDDPVRFSLPPRPYGGPAVSVRPDGAAAAGVEASLGSKTAMIGDDTAAVMIADEKLNAKDPANAGETESRVRLARGHEALGSVRRGLGKPVPAGGGPERREVPGEPGPRAGGTLRVRLRAERGERLGGGVVRACAANDGDGGLFTTWNSETCRELMKGANFFMRVVVTNPSDVVMTLTQFKPRVWLGGREGSVAEAPANSETTVEARAAATLDFYVTVPWESEESFIVDARRWWRARAWTSASTPPSARGPWASRCAWTCPSSHTKCRRSARWRKRRRR